MRHTHRHPISGGFTLLEAMLAIAVISVMGLSIAGVSMALSTAHDNSQDAYQCTQTGRIVMMRLEQMLRQTHLVTDAVGSSVMLWDDDANGDGQINATELTALMYSSNPQTLTRYRIKFPDSWPESWKTMADAQLPLSAATFTTMAKSPLFRRYQEAVVMAEGVESLSFQLDGSVPLAEAAAVEMTIARGDSSLTVRGGVTFRAAQTHRVSQSGGVYMLNP